MITRRGFLGSLGIGAAALALCGVSRATDAGSITAVDIPATLDTTLNVGDVFTIAGRQSLNPLTGEASGHLQRFVVTTTVQAGKMLEVKDVWPKPTTDGPYANIAGRPVGAILDSREVSLLSWGEVVPCEVTWADA